MKERQKEIFEVWRDKVYGMYPPETQKFLKREADRFENPLGYRLEEALRGLLKELVEGVSWEEVDRHLDRIIRIEAVQSIRPSQAVSFLYYLKSALREVVGEEIVDRYGVGALLELEDVVDGMVLRAFNQYMAARERLNEIKYEEWKSRLFLLLKRAGYLYDQREGSLPREAGNSKTN